MADKELFAGVIPCFARLEHAEEGRNGYTHNKIALNNNNIIIIQQKNKLFVIVLALGTKRSKFVNVIERMLKRRVGLAHAIYYVACSRDRYSKILILYEIVNHVLITLQTIYPTIMALHVLLGIYAYFTTTHNYYELMMMSL